jgi:hypothetical protein
MRPIGSARRTPRRADHYHSGHRIGGLFDVPAASFLAIIYPGLAGKAEVDPAMAAAQQALVDSQKRAMELVEGLPYVIAVRWELDIRWLADHGVVGPVTR